MRVGGWTFRPYYFRLVPVTGLSKHALLILGIQRHVRFKYRRVPPPALFVRRPFLALQRNVDTLAFLPLGLQRKREMEK
jgi:hypothetical protein